MGCMTEICFLNDGWHNLKQSILDDPQQFVQEIQELMNGRYVVPSGARQYPGDLDRMMRLGNGSTVYPSHHADESRLYLSWRNSFLSLDKWSLEREFGTRLDNPNDHIIDALEKDVREAESILRETKRMLKAKREARKAAA